MRKSTQNSGVIVNASSHDESSAMVITLKRGAVYSPVVDCASEIGRNAAAVVSDEISSGTRNSRAEPTAASTGRRPAAIRTMIDSAITMALSTSMPSAMIEGGERHLVEPDVEEGHHQQRRDHRHRHEARHHQPGARAEKQQHHGQDDGDGLPEIDHEFADLALDDLRLEGDDVEVDADGIERLQALYLPRDPVPEIRSRIDNTPCS